MLVAAFFINNNMKLHQILEAKYAGDHGIIELTQAPRVPGAEKKQFDRLVNDGWTSKVEYRGENVFELVYGDELRDFLEREMRDYHEDKDRDFDGQESYLGYIPNEDAFVMGWDLWVSENDYYGGQEQIEDAENMMFFTLEGGGIRDNHVISEGHGHMYPSGYRALHAMYPSIVDVRLD
jgi:hypothetical protein